MFVRSSKRSAAASAAAAATPSPSPPRLNSPSSASSRRPRLERRNAAKNIEYDPYASSWTSSASSPDDSVGLRATRSLDLPYSNQTSFRIEGIEGEVDELCRSLGLSGPEEFAIPAAAWEARKARSALDILPPSRLIESQSSPESPSDSPRPRDSADPQGSPDVAVRDGFADLRSSPSPPKNSAGDVDGGIKGVRPPVLTPPQLRSPTMIRTLPPPPSMSLPMLEKTGSTWDLVKSFAPDDDGGGDAGKTLYGSDEDDDGERVVEDEGAAEVRFGETVHDLIGSCSFSTNDDDSSSTTTESTFVISPNGNFKITIGSWMRGGLLGSGSFGTVYEGINEDGFFFAAKEVSLLDQGSNAKQSILQLEQEIALLSQFEHENIVQYFGTDRKESKLYIFLELVTQGSLASLYQKYHLKDSQVSAYTRQILNGLNYLHDRNVVHRDIKCANILVAANGSVKLADFGLAKITKLNDLKSCKGSAFWMAPEVVNQKRSYGPAADIWSLGCTVLEMLTRQIPYPNLEWIQAILRIGRGEQPPIPSTLSKDARDFIRKCVQVNPDDRPTAAQLLDHPFVKRPLSTSSPENSVRNGTRTSKFV